jgi:hypothetical protein
MKESHGHEGGGTGLDEVEALGGGASATEGWEGGMVDVEFCASAAEGWAGGGWKGWEEETLLWYHVELWDVHVLIGDEVQYI